MFSCKLAKQNILLIFTQKPFSFCCCAVLWTYVSNSLCGKKYLAQVVGRMHMVFEWISKSTFYKLALIIFEADRIFIF